MYKEISSFKTKQNENKTKQETAKVQMKAEVNAKQSNTQTNKDINIYITILTQTYRKTNCTNSQAKKGRSLHNISQRVLLFCFQVLLCALTPHQPL